ncbi:CRISPR-associated protein Cas2 [Geomicrobium sp. JCM 19037]|uniref:CRISPR-associated endonuclease Cas2 n=1 Tax=unclassified Geomicrobium TaxID=2628951 RepID=UPI00045F13CE|nr:CRISPR-associated endonuclease Cas2 [Geomicrobium sp. JCM 19037]GAK05755.1 CRISPR-associated protein Cas2 [Geomicrobium sp. JCM 19037]
MLDLITYDVKTSSTDGPKQLRKVSKACQNYGQRVQNSVFECVLDTAQLKALTYKLEEIINVDEDSLRIYRLGKNYKSKVEHIGAKPSINIEEPLIF